MGVGRRSMSLDALVTGPSVFENMIAMEVSLRWDHAE